MDDRTETETDARFDAPDSSGAGAAGAPTLTEVSALREMASVALPAVVTMTSLTLMQYVDKLIVGQVNADAIAALGNGGIAAFVPASVLMGVLSIVNTYVAQNLGAGRPRRGAAYAWNGLWLTAIAWLVLLVPYGAFMSSIFAEMRALFGVDVSALSPGLVRMEQTYGQILVYGLIFTIAARGLSHYFYGMHRPAVVMISAIVGNGVNIFLCAGFVLGKWGLPQLDVAVGAAVSTVVGGVIELVIPLALFLSPRWDRQYGTRGAWRPSLSRMREIVRLGWPAGVMFGNEIVCWWIFLAVLVTRFDTGRDVAVNNIAGWITLQYMHLAFMPAVGMSIGVTALVGRAIGRGRPDLARSRAWLGLRWTMIYMGACALAFVLFGESLTANLVSEKAAPSAEVRGEIIALGASLLALAAVFQLFDAIAITLSGALRGAGDTVWPGVVTIVSSWGIIVGGGYGIALLAPQLGSYGPWIAAAAYIIVLAVLFLWRFIKGDWERIELVDHGGPDDDAPPGHAPEDLGFSFQGSEGELR